MIYVRTGNSWTQQQTLTRPEGLGFGGTLAVHGDTLIAARLNWDSGSTAAYVYVRSGSTWTFQAELSPSGSVGHYPRQIAVDSDTAILSYGSGGVYVFVRNGTTWSEQARLRPEDPPGQDAFQGQVDISGNTVVIGNPSEAVDGFTNHGAAYVFVRSGSTWTLQARLAPAAGRRSAYIGSVVTLSGSSLIVGPGGGGYLFERVGATWVPQASLPVPPKPHPAWPEYALRNVVLNLDTAVASFSPDLGAPRSSWVYKRIAGSWVRLDPVTVVLGNVALSGNALISGFPSYNGDQGIAYLYAVANTAPPDAVTLAGEVNGASVYLNWTLASTGTAASAYIIEAGTAPGATNYFNGNVGSLRHLYSPPLPNGRYYIRVRPVNAFGVGPASNEVVLTVGPPPVAVPGPPTLDASVTDNIVSLTWSPSPSGGTPTSYWLEAGTSAGAIDLYNGSIGTGTALNAAVTPGPYYIRVRGVNAGGAGPASNERVFTATGCAVPLVPNGLHFTRDGSVVTVRWNVTPGAVEYFLRAGTAPNIANLFTGTNGRFTSVSASVGPGTYYVRVQAVNDCGFGGLSAELEIQVP